MNDQEPHASKLLNLRVPDKMLGTWKSYHEALPARVPFSAFIRRALNVYVSLLHHEQRGGSFIIVKPNGQQITDHAFTPKEKFNG